MLRRALAPVLLLLLLPCVASAQKSPTPTEYAIFGDSLSDDDLTYFATGSTCLNAPVCNP